jgi:hypothetical protein
MAFKELRKRLRASVEELDNARLQDRFVGVSVTPICDAPLRTPIRVGGEIKRVLIAPRSGVPALEIMISDGTGSAVAIFSGRRNLPGISHGRAVLLEGVAHDERGRRVLLNPAYTLLP